MNQVHSGKGVAAKLVILLLISCCFSGVTTASAAEQMLPQVYRAQVDVSGWLMSEKLDGVRGYWTGAELLSKNGNRLFPPAEFIQQLPPFALEGELWAGRGTFEQAVSIVTQQQPHPGWQRIKFAIFDLPQSRAVFSARLKQAQHWFAEHRSTYAFIIPQLLVRDQAHLHAELLRIENLGGEGLIVRNPKALYSAGRSSEILKVKSFQDAEARVLAYLPGKGRNLGRLGALFVALENGIQFKLGSGFSDAERQSPPPLGALITFKYYGSYRSGIPKFPSFLRIRRDRQL